MVNFILERSNEPYGTLERLGNNLLDKTQPLKSWTHSNCVCPHLVFED